MDEEVKRRIQWKLRRYRKLYEAGGNLATGLSRREFVRMMIRRDATKVAQVREKANQEKLTEIILDRQLESARAFYDSRRR